ncbi:MAG TPA: hypothetical protein PJ990_14325 [Saprospiraceae bacterium]|nr:hypothetical protein [Saprospiraceae bacterium]
MKYSEIKKIATERLGTELFKQHGFELKKGGLGGGFGFYNHGFENRSLFVGCSIAKYGDTSIVGHIGGGLIFKEIEYLLIPLLVKTKLMGESSDKFTNTTIAINKIHGFENHNFSRFCEEIIIKDESGVKILVDRIKEFYYEIAVPAFDSFISIEKFVPMMENLDFYDFTKIFGMGSQFKKALVWKLCNRSDYEEYMIDLIERTEKFLGPNRDQIEGYKWYNTAVELKAILDNTPAKYNL